MKDISDINLQDISKIEEEWRISPTRPGEMVAVISENMTAEERGPGFKFEIKVKKKWYLVSSSTEIENLIRNGLAKLHNNGYIKLF